MRPFPEPVPAIPDDPLISSDYTGWWRRTVRIMRTVWPQLVALQLAGTAVSLAIAIGLSTDGPSPDDASGAAAVGDLAAILLWTRP
ncbi:hypothetical protein [Couchioplanes caeruleus]|uniref:Uncharacterized protein n=1 Tax=Couchioplanes caeruleus subsp. caeruleus TaxID=56427 RepID=A0A1K0GSS8_9ACTN|nr:hypothetical protein [Couchioplanes caeruleus]OJF12339.1 hypothetical protein BG844_21225 [Couchioplanes caeruleus subsp. caeruleus]